MFAYIHTYTMSESPGTKTCPGRAHKSPLSHSCPCHFQRPLRLVQATEVAVGGAMVLSDLAFTDDVRADERGNEYALTSLSLVLRWSCRCRPTSFTGILLSPHIVAISPPSSLAFASTATHSSVLSLSSSAKTSFCYAGVSHSCHFVHSNPVHVFNLVNSSAPLTAHPSSFTPQ